MTTGVVCIIEEIEPHLFVRLEDIASERVVWHFPSDVTEDLHVLRVVRHIEDPARRERERE